MAEAMFVPPRHPLPGSGPTPESLPRNPRQGSRLSCRRPLELRFLGGFEVVAAGRVVHGFAPRKVQALLAYLTLASGHEVSRDRLAGLLWSAASEAAAHQSLRQAIYSLRRRLGASGRSAVGADAREVWLDPAIVAASDVARFEAAAAAAGDPRADLIAAQESIVALYRGELLEGLFVEGCEKFNEWLEGERSRLRALAIAALLALLDRHEIDGGLEAGMAVARELILIDPLSEEAHRHLIRLLGRAGRRDEALAEFAAWRKQLATDLGAQPTRATEALHQSLLSSAYLPDVPAPLNGVAKPLIAFVGREPELAALHQEWEIVRRGGRRTTVVAGSSGVGKSRLVRSFLDQVCENRPDVRVVVAADPGAERESLHPELEPRPGLARDGGGDRRPVVVLREDSGCDRCLAADLVGGLDVPADLPIWILATQRTADSGAPVSAGPAVAAGGDLAGRETFGASVGKIHLGRLDAVALRTLAAALVGAAAAESLAEALVAATGGLPWAVAEAINLLADEGVLAPACGVSGVGGLDGPDRQSWRLAGPLGDFPLPATADGLVERRLALLPRFTRRVLVLAAIAGTRFDGALLAAAEGETRSAVEAALVVLMDRRFVRPWVPGWLPRPRDRDRALAAAGASCGRCEFLCPTLREAVCRLLPEARRRAVEREIEAARALAVAR